MTDSSLSTHRQTNKIHSSSHTLSLSLSLSLSSESVASGTVGAEASPASFHLCRNHFTKFKLRYELKFASNCVWLLAVFFFFFVYIWTEHKTKKESQMPKSEPKWFRFPFLFISDPCASHPFHPLFNTRTTFSNHYKNSLFFIFIHEKLHSRKNWVYCKKKLDYSFNWKGNFTNLNE